MRAEPRRRVLDGVIGATVLLLVQVVVLAAAWFWVSSPGAAPSAGSGQQPAGDAPSPTAAAQPPANLPRDQSWLSDLHAEGSSVVVHGTRLTDVQLSLGDVQTTSAGVQVGSLSATGTVPMADVEALAGSGTRLEYVDADHVRVTREVSFVGRNATATGVATVEPDGQALVITPTSIELPGFGQLGLSAMRSLLAVRQPVHGLPAGVTIRSTQVQPDGLRIELVGSDVAID